VCLQALGSGAKANTAFRNSLDIFDQPVETICFWRRMMVGALHEMRFAAFPQQ
jgi:hypothetical protein